MNEKYKVFTDLLEQEKKEEALTYALDLVKNNEVDLIDLYTNILAPSLNNMECKLADKNICIWKEHVRTAIIRTIVECCYPYVIDKKKKLNYTEGKTAVVLCPPEEYHDLGARMVADFFTICGFHTIFVGSNTPYQDFYNALYVIKPDIVAISVSNYYNLVETKKIIKELKEKRNANVKIVVGGYAFNRKPENYITVGADAYIRSYEDIQKLAQNSTCMQEESAERG